MFQMQGWEGRGTMETYNGLLSDKLPATFKWIYLNVQKKARIGEPRSEGEVENQSL